MGSDICVIISSVAIRDSDTYLSSESQIKRITRMAQILKSEPKLNGKRYLCNHFIRDSDKCLSSESNKWQNSSFKSLRLQN